ncbi:NAD-dependent epimerase/dehydratase family protein [Pedobacter africanus]|uniref:Nucleoside-diphosphate-sugar epimerase n=1 Tax=Pedobacter africanus TaxID=151894 RepID=A0A1W2BZS0_9SPHI|nr:NAD-dependent epimerase/dehydratase family protein [Pedobacter africanus]SMC78152.1 Nucleoside-diphosphate-sugar epimerase [Pedobacter africanus]
MSNLAQLEQEILKPSAALVEDVSRIEGDILLLGVGGKMGPSMARAARQAIDIAGSRQRVIGVSRFSDAASRAALEAVGVETIAADLLNDAELNALPDAPNVIYLAGHKFGTTGKEAFTWAMNAYLPGRVAEKYRNSNIVAFSSGNVLPFVPVTSGGVSEESSPEPIGEYAQSCLGRERIFEYFSQKNNTPMLIYRLNYAVDFRYGVLVELAKSVLSGKEIDLRTENVNVIWQGDANEIAIRSLLHCASPAKILNVTGPEILSTRWAANQFGRIFGKEPKFVNESAGTALLNNASECHRLFGYPKVTIREIIELTATWMQQGGEALNKPTHFQERTGKF